MRPWVLKGLALLAVLVAFEARTESGVEVKGEGALEARGFFHDPVDARQADADVSFRLQPEFYAEWNERNTSVTFTPFGRWDSADDERTHWDIREWYLRHRSSDFETRVGIRKVFWGATESVHLVDIINQTDLVENPDGEDKLGQPMANLAWTRDGRTLDLFVLPYFRERTFPGVEGRLRPVVSVVPPFPPGTPPAYVSNDESAYESQDEEQHVDWAARYAYSGGNLDFALSHFSGTARAPRFISGPGGIVMTSEGPALVPFYDLIERTGFDATYVMDGWLMKLEGIYQHSDVDDYSAAAGGFEYTVTGAFETAVDVGLLAEYIWDERDELATTPFNNDIFLGTRIAANDEASSELLAGAIVDADTQAAFANLEASRRLGAGFKLTLEARLFERAEPGDPAYSFRQDDYLSLELAYFY